MFKKLLLCVGLCSSICNFTVDELPEKKIEENVDNKQERINKEQELTFTQADIKEFKESAKIGVLSIINPLTRGIVLATIVTIACRLGNWPELT